MSQLAKRGKLRHHRHEPLMTEVDGRWANFVSIVINVSSYTAHNTQWVVIFFLHIYIYAHIVIFHLTFKDYLTVKVGC